MSLSLTNEAGEEAACAGSEQQLTVPCVFLPVSLQCVLHHINVMFQTASSPSVWIPKQEQKKMEQEQLHWAKHEQEINLYHWY